MNSNVQFRFLSLLSRLLISAIFIIAGLSKIAGWNTTAGYMAAKGMGYVPVFLTIAIIIEIVCGVALLLGYRARGAAAILFLYLIPVTILFHDFWSYTGADAQMQFTNFVKNIAILGGLLSFVVNGAGAISIDARRLRRGEPPGPVRVDERALKRAI